MQDYIKQVDEAGKKPTESPRVDATQPVFRSSQKVIEEVMHAAAGGKVHVMEIYLIFLAAFGLIDGRIIMIELTVLEDD